MKIKEIVGRVTITIGMIAYILFFIVCWLYWSVFLFFFLYMVNNDKEMFDILQYCAGIISFVITFIVGFTAYYLFKIGRNGRAVLYLLLYLLFPIIVVSGACLIPLMMSN